MIIIMTNCGLALLACGPMLPYAVPHCNYAVQAVYCARGNTPHLLRTVILAACTSHYLVCFLLPHSMRCTCAMHLLLHNTCPTTADTLSTCYTHHACLTSHTPHSVNLMSHVMQLGLYRKGSRTKKLLSLASPCSMYSSSKCLRCADNQSKTSIHIKHRNTK